MDLGRRALLGAVGGGLAATAGCVEAAADTASGCGSLPPDDANTPTDVREALPDYDGPPADRDERWDRADEIQDALWKALEDHPWRCSIGQTTADGELVIVVGVNCVPRAWRYVPDEWGGIPIRLEQKFCGTFELA